MAREFPHCDVVGVDLVPPRFDKYVLQFMYRSPLIKLLAGSYLRIALRSMM